MQQDFIYDEEPKAILPRQMKQLRNKQVPLVKVLWQNQDREEATWDPEATMRAQFLGGGRIVIPRNIPVDPTQSIGRCDSLLIKKKVS